MRKYTHALTANENPNANDVYSSCCGVNVTALVMTFAPWLLFDATLEVCAPEKAKNRNYHREATQSALLQTRAV